MFAYFRILDARARLNVSSLGPVCRKECEEGTFAAHPTRAAHIGIFLVVGRGRGLCDGRVGQAQHKP